MAMKYKVDEFGTQKGILAAPHDFFAIGVLQEQATAEGGIVKKVDGRFVVKAGTIYPANDSTATGVILNDYDVTDGDANMAVVIFGFIQTSKLPEPPAADVNIKMVQFLPLS